MNCPNCNTKLTLSERQDIEIDYCPECRGVWLDRGELDKIIERSAQLQDISGRDDHRPDEHLKKKKREGFLGELFGF